VFTYSSSIGWMGAEL